MKAADDILVFQFILISFRMRFVEISLCHVTEHQLSAIMTSISLNHFPLHPPQPFYDLSCFIRLYFKSFNQPFASSLFVSFGFLFTF